MHSSAKRSDKGNCAPRVRGSYGLSLNIIFNEQIRNLSLSLVVDCDLIYNLRMV